MEIVARVMARVAILRVEKRVVGLRFVVVLTLRTTVTAKVRVCVDVRMGLL